MNKSNRIRIVGSICVAVIWIIIAIFAWVFPPKELSEAERRKLEQFPELTVENVFNGSFTEDFEDYTLDQFPARDTFRRIKSLFHYYVLRQKDNNDIYIYNDYAAKMEYPLNNKSVQNAVEKLNYVYETYLKDADVNIYMSVIPDKGYYMADQSGHMKMDYDGLFSNMASINWAEYIDLVDLLSIESYYQTDTHWRQEKIVNVVQRLSEAMGVEIPENDEFVVDAVKKPFYGVYYGQAALPMRPESMFYLTSEYTNNSTVYDYETNKTVAVYDTEAVDDSKDLYDTYLHGAKALLKIENPIAKTDKELIIFRDSFGSSLVPLMLKGYKTITVVDLRYISSRLLSKYIDFDNQDILFIYSSLVINNSFTLK